jgi:hypothetical protein
MESFVLDLQSAIDNQQSTIALHYCDPFARWDLLAVCWDDDVAICASRGHDVSRSLPRDQLDLRMFEFAGQDRGKKTLEAGFNADFFFQSRMKECQ